MCTTRCSFHAVPLRSSRIGAGGAIPNVRSSFSDCDMYRSVMTSDADAATEAEGASHSGDVRPHVFNLQTKPRNQCPARLPIKFVNNMTYGDRACRVGTQRWMVAKHDNDAGPSAAPAEPHLLYHLLYRRNEHAATRHVAAGRLGAESPRWRVAARPGLTMTLCRYAENSANS